MLLNRFSASPLFCWRSMTSCCKVTSENVVPYGLGRDPETGKRKQKTVSGFKTKKEAQIAASAILKELAEESYIVEKDILLATFISEWINLYKH